MAEGYSHNPNEASADSTESAPKRAEAGDRFKNFLGELFKPKTEKEKKPAVESADDDDEEATEKKSNTSESVTKVGRFTRAWRSFFPKLASKEELPAGERGLESRQSPRGLFFESNTVDAEPSEVVEQEQAISSTNEVGLPQYEQASEQTDTNMSTIETVPALVDTEASVVNSDRVIESSEPGESVEPNPNVSQNTQVEASTESAQVLPEAVAAEHMQRQAQTETIASSQSTERTPTAPERITAPVTATATERVVVSGLTNADRLRLRQMERHEKDIERDTKHIKKELDRRPPSPNFMRPRTEAVPAASYTERVVPRGPETVTPRTAEKQTIREIQKEIVNKKIDLSSQVERQKVVEKQPVYEHVSTPEQFAVKEKFSEVQKERIIESVLDKVDNKEVDSHKEISYELSHEAKDMDKQSAAAWTAMQASADAQAKANAAAIAAAQAAVGDQAESLKQVAKSQSAAMYQQAALGGFVAAVVIIAIIIVILLLK